MAKRSDQPGSRRRVTPRRAGEPGSGRGRGRRARILRTPLKEAIGMPPSIMLLLIAAAILLGVMLSWGLSVSSQTSTSAAVPAGSQSERGVDASGLPVLTENSIGKEVQRLVDTGTLQNPASFDVTACMQEQGVDDQILMIEEVSWMDSGPAWLLVHSATTADVIHTEGGEVNATVVRSSCGTPESKGASSSRLWNGAVKLVPTS